MGDMDEFEMQLFSLQSVPQFVVYNVVAIFVQGLYS